MADVIDSQTAPPPTILIVDDNRAKRLALASALEQLGAGIVLAESGREALHVLLRQEVAVILLDVQMPEMDGFETAKLIRSRAQSSLTPIIFVTAYNRAEMDMLSGYSAGAYDYVFTPMIAEVLRAKVSVFLELYKKAETVKRHELRLHELEAAELTRHLEVHRLAELESARVRDHALEASRLKSELLASISHEIRTPMSGVIGMAELLLRSDLSAEQRDFAETIRQSADSLLALINDLLDYSKLEAGKMTIESLDMDVVTVVEAAADLFVEQASQKGVALTTFVDARIPGSVCGDALRLRQVLLNLIGNAIKFTTAGSIDVRATLRGIDAAGAVVIDFAVSDTGIGMGADEQRGLFEPFTQAESATSRLFGGTGLGLSISRQLIDLMNGEVRVESRKGSGSTFSFHATFAASRNKSLERGLSARRVNGVRSLLIGSNPTTAAIVHEYLSSAGILNVVVSDVDEALQTLAKAMPSGPRFDVVLIDLQAGAHASIELGKRIAEDVSLGAPHLTLLISHAERALGTLAIEASFTSYVKKPLRKDKLLHAIACAVDATAERSDETGLAAASSGPETFEHLTILVAEDHSVNQRLILYQLTILGASADVVPDGKRAVEAVFAKHYDLVLMDCHMPQLNGFDATRDIRKREIIDGGHIPIIALTANVQRKDREECADAGMDAFLSKPVRIEELRLALQRWFPANEPAGAGAGRLAAAPAAL